MLSPLPAATHVFVIVYLPFASALLDTAVVAIPVLLLLAVGFTPSEHCAVNVFVVPLPAYVNELLLLLNVVLPDALLTVNAYVAVALLYVEVAALLTVIVALPPFLAVAVTVVPLTLASDTLVSLLLALNVPPLVFVLTVKVLLFGYVVLPLDALKLNVFAFFAVVNAYVLLHELY